MKVVIVADINEDADLSHCVLNYNTDNGSMSQVVKPRLMNEIFEKLDKFKKTCRVVEECGKCPYFKEDTHSNKPICKVYMLLHDLSDAMLDAPMRWNMEFIKKNIEELLNTEAE